MVGTGEQDSFRSLNVSSHKDLQIDTKDGYI